jgi:hypothetical protein
MILTAFDRCMCTGTCCTIIAEWWHAVAEAVTAATVVSDYTYILEPAANWCHRLQQDRGPVADSLQPQACCQMRTPSNTTAVYHVLHLNFTTSRGRGTLAAPEASRESEQVQQHAVSADPLLYRSAEQL